MRHGAQIGWQGAHPLSATLPGAGAVASRKTESAAGCRGWDAEGGRKWGRYEMKLSDTGERGSRDSTIEVSCARHKHDLSVSLGGGSMRQRKGEGEYTPRLP